MKLPKIEVPNKYNLTPAKIRSLKVNREKLGEAPFWRNDVIGAWCISGSTAKNSKDVEFCTEDEYWLGVYDEDAKAYAGKVRFSLTSYGGMCGYNITGFYKPDEIENRMDFEVQAMFLKVLNQLIDDGVLIMGA